MSVHLVPHWISPGWIYAAVMIVWGSAVLVMTPTALAATVTVTTDAVDSGMADASLRSAIESINTGTDANATIGAGRVGTYGVNDRIEFNIPGAGPHTIDVQSEPWWYGSWAIRRPVVIDGYSQPGASPNTLAVGSNAVLRIELRRLCPLDIIAQGVTIRGLAMNGGGTFTGCSSNSESLRVNGNDARIIGNFIGTDVTGRIARTMYGGVTLLGMNSIIGGTDPADRNVISGHYGHGILSVTLGSKIVGNIIGPDSQISPGVGNSMGILFLGSGQIGGDDPGAGNDIAYNSQFGIAVIDCCPPNQPLVTNGPIIGNRIFQNGIAGIVLTVDTLFFRTVENDEDDVDVGPNALQNHPVIHSATTGLGGDAIFGSLNSTPGRSFRIELFSNPGCGDPSSSVYYPYGQGETRLSSFDVTTNASGDVQFRVTSLPPLGLGNSITATASELQAGPGSAPLWTSNFSRCTPVRAAGVTVTPQSGLTTTESGATATFQVRLHTVPSTTVSIGLSSSNLAEGTISPSVLQFSPDATALQPQTVTVTGVNDSRIDGPVLYSIVTAPAVTSDPAYSGMNPPDVALVNSDNEPPPALQVADASIVEGDTGTTTVGIAVTLSSASNLTVTVQYATADGTAMAGSDYLPLPLTTLTFLPGEISKTIPLMVLADVRDEGDETVRLNLSNPSNAVIADGQGVITVTDDDPLPTLSIASVAVDEGASGTTPAQLAVSLSAPSGRAVSLHYATADVTATAGSDYLATSGTLTFIPGEISKMVTVLVTGDIVAEPNEMLAVVLTQPVNASIRSGTGTVIIRSDDDDTVCVPRPPVQVISTAVVRGRLEVTVTATSLLVSASNALQEIRFGSATNAVISIGSVSGSPGGFTHTLPPNTKSVTFTVERQVAGSMTAPFVVRDQCGDWPTFVGSGPGI
ncbi:MAG: Calx-beta domain-containing protein [Chloroflexota bacterium]